MDKSFFSSNRKNLMSLLTAELLVISAYTKQQSSGDSAHTFKQEPNFWYLTGIEHSDWQLVIDSRRGVTWLIAPEVDKIHELFDGSLTFDDAKKTSGVDEVITKKEGEKLLQELASEHKAVYTIGAPSYASRVDFVLNPAPSLLRKRLTKLFNEVKDCQKELGRLRAVKQPEEIGIIKTAIGLTAGALERAKAKIAADRYEYEIEAELAYHFRCHDAGHGFEPIVAGGKNACTLHYVANNDRLQEGSMLLIDSGARLGYYSADITRTFAVGEVTERQKAVYEAVRKALEEIVKLLKPGVSIERYIDMTDETMKRALISVGLMKDRTDIDNYRKYFPHAISHGLGLDVHESLGGHKEFLPGMVVTVEPGIYIPEEAVGVRIEDDILITKSGNENLTVGVSTDL